MKAIAFWILVLSVSGSSQVVLEPHARIASAVAKVKPEALEASVRKLVSFGTRHTLSESTDPTRGIGAARQWLIEELTRYAAASEGRLTVREDPHDLPPSSRLPAGGRVVNVVATLRGSEPERTIVMSAHYDSRASRGEDSKIDAPGANDDASGCAVVLEAARILATESVRQNVVFLFTAAEEQGLLGAKGFAQAAPRATLRIDAMVTTDIVGAATNTRGQVDPWTLRLFSEGVISGPLNERGRPTRTVVGSDQDAPSRQLARYLKLRGETYVPGFKVRLIFRQDRYLRGGDHRAFNEEGFAGARFTEPFENYDRQHQDLREEAGRRFGDLPEFLDYAFMTRVAQTNIAGFLEMALAPAAPANVRMLTSQLTPDTELRFAPPAMSAEAGGSKPARIAILIRRTDEPTWTERRLLEEGATSALLEGLSKDDWLFGVEAIGPEGFRSLPVYPQPSAR